MERKERGPIPVRKIDKKTLGLWALSGSSLVLMWGSLQLASESLRLKREEIVWIPNVPTEYMETRLIEANQKRLIDAENNERFAIVLISAAWISQINSVRFSRKRK